MMEKAPLKLLIGVLACYLVSANKSQRVSEDRVPFTAHRDINNHQYRVVSKSGVGYDSYYDDWISHGSGDVDAVVGQCRNASCFEPKAAAGSGQPLNRRLKRFLSGGPSQFIWDVVFDKNISEKLMVGNECLRSLRSTAAAMDLGREWAFRFLDAAGKTPPAFQESTVLSFGDYDECLAIDSGQFMGKHCMVDIFPVGLPNTLRPLGEEGRFRVHDFITFKGSPFYYGFCLPSTCSENDVRQLVAVALEELPFQVSGKVSCDTADSISWPSRLQSLNAHQVVAMIFIASFLGLVGVATAVHLLSYRHDNEYEFLKGLSLLKNSMAVLTVSESAQRQSAIDMFRLFMTTMASISHYIACLESPIARQTLLQYIFRQPMLQPMFNEAGLGMMVVISGYFTFKTAYPLAASRRLPYKAAFLDRYLRHAPSVAAIVALDLLWPAMFSGPLYSRVAKFTLDKCTKNWWASISFLSPIYSPVDMCAAHTYTSAIDVQLFAAGLLVLYIYSRRPKLGDMVCVLAIISNLYMLGYRSYVNNVTPALFVSNSPTAQKTVDYLETVHMKTYVYAPAFFAGFLLARATENGLKLDVRTPWKRYTLWALNFLLFQGALYSHALPNSFGIVPREFTWLYIVCLKVLFTITVGLFLLLVHSHEQDQLLQANEKSSAAEDEYENFREIRALLFIVFKISTRLSFSMYMSNYLFIRTDFFTSRVPFPNFWFSFVKRTLTAVIMLFFVAFAFHVLFVAPFEHIRRTLLSSQPRDHNGNSSTKENIKKTN